MPPYRWEDEGLGIWHAPKGKAEAVPNRERVP